MQNRIYYLDNLKGILIMLVVLGHVIQFTFPDTYQHNFMFRFIYSFHMPLFFAVSGYLTCKSYFDKELVKKRALQLLVPFVLWALFFPIVKQSQDMTGNFIKALLYPDNGLWFLYNLFVYSLMFNLSERFSYSKGKQEWWLAALVCTIFIGMAVLHTLFNLTQLCWFFPFFAIGYYCKKYRYFMKENKVLNIVVGGGYCVTLPFWMMREEPTFYEYINLGGAFAYVYRWGVMMLATVFFMNLGRKFLDRQIPLLSYLSKNTLGVYALHFLILFYMMQVTISVNSYINIFLITILTLIITLIVVEIFSRFRITKILIGKK